MDDQSRSGNRWEPDGDGQTQPVQVQGASPDDAGGASPAAQTSAAPAGTAVLPPPVQEAAAAGEGAPPARGSWRDSRQGPRRPLVLGVAAVVLMLVMGIGGFLLGRATAPDGFDGLDGHGGPGFGPGQQGQLGQPGQGFDPRGDGDGLPGQSGDDRGQESENGTGGSDGTADTTLYVVRAS